MSERVEEDYNLTDVEQACLLLLKDGFKNMPSEIFNEKTKDRLLYLNLIQLDDNKEVKWSLTKQGYKALETKIAIKYPLHVKGKIGDYNKVITTMSDGAKNALLCSQINNHFFDQIPPTTLRVMMQNFLDTGLYKKFGKTLTDKLIEHLQRYQV